jgi:hypothetical protein
MNLVIVNSGQKEITRGQFESINDLNEWLQKHIAKNTFGLPERPETILNENGELVETGNILPAEYEIVIEDLTQEIEQQAKFQAAMDEIAKGIKGIAVFKVKVKDKQLTSSQIAQLFASSEIKTIIETLSTGSLPLAAYLISNYPADGVIVTEEDKQAVLQAIS